MTEEGHWSKEKIFENKVVGGSVPREYISSVERGVMDALTSGALAGYPVVGVKVTLIDGSYHPVDSSDLAFEQAGAMGVQEGLKKAHPVLLEPVMRLSVVTPESNMGSVQASLMSKRGMITDSHIHGQMRVIEANAPLAEMFGYSSEIRSITAGRGSYTMEPWNYERVPAQIAKKILM
jgi:elongation factor G